MLSRNGNDFASRFPELHAELLELPDIVLDGELVVLDKEGLPQFDRLSRRSLKHGACNEPAVLFAFDLLELDGVDLRDWTLLDRKKTLQEALAGFTWIRYTDQVHERGVAHSSQRRTMVLRG